jgi:uncharacterized phage protein (TIGR02218 family)
MIPAWLTTEIVPLAWCWRIERTDGATLGLTTHDRDVIVGALLYRAAPGIRPSAIRQAMGLDGDRMDIEGALTAEALSASDLISGRWNGARLTLSIVDWEAPDERSLVVAEGELGEVTIDGSGFSAELRGVDRGLNAPIIPFTSAACRAALGDRRCGVALAPLSSRHSVSAQAGAVLTIPTAPSHVGLGRVRWLTGPLRGRWADVLTQDGAAITLADAPMLPIPAGTQIMVQQGCDKRAETCRTRFANIANFRGEPHLPGIDLLMRYPGG